MTTIRAWLPRSLFALLAGLLACNDGLAGNHGTQIGLSCATSDECDLGGICVVDAPSGFCSQECEEPGEAQQCPLGSYCDFGEFATDVEDKTSRTLCLAACKAQSDCRRGYECVDVSSGPGKICRPEE